MSGEFFRRRGIGVAYDPILADLIRLALGERPGIVEKHMFGGIAFMLNGNMCAGIVKDQLMLRSAPEQYDALLEREGVQPMEFTGRPMRGFVFVDASATTTVAAVRRWLKPSLAYVDSLPAKPPTRKPARKK